MWEGEYSPVLELGYGVRTSDGDAVVLIEATSAVSPLYFNFRSSTVKLIITGHKNNMKMKREEEPY